MAKKQDKPSAKISDLISKNQKLAKQAFGDRNPESKASKQLIELARKQFGYDPDRIGDRDVWKKIFHVWWQSKDK